MSFLVSSYIETVGVKWPGRKQIFCLLSDTLLHIFTIEMSFIGSLRIVLFGIRPLCAHLFLGIGILFKNLLISLIFYI